MTNGPQLNLPAEATAAAELVALLREQLDGDEDSQLIVDMIEGSTSLVEALRAAMERLEYLEDDRDAAVARKKQQEARIASRETSIERLKALLHRTLERVPELVPFREPGRYTISLAKKPAQVAVDIDPKDLPVDYLRVLVEPRRSELKKALQDGAEIDGVRLVEGGTQLMIRRA